MKLRTHYIFSAGLISLFLSLLFRIDFFDNLTISLLVSILGNTVIDGLGHKETTTRFGEIPVRTPLTHTVPRSVIWGLVSTLPLLPIPLYLTHYYYWKSLFFISILISGILVGPSHMLLDAFTEKGIYVKKNGKWRRFALAHFKYDNPLVNGLAIFAGATMLYLSYIFS